MSNVSVKLTPDDLVFLSRETKGSGGFQCLLRSLAKTRVGYFQHLEPAQYLRIMKYSFAYGPGGFQDRLARIATRLLRKRFRSGSNGYEQILGEVG